MITLVVDDDALNTTRIVPAELDECGVCGGDNLACSLTPIFTPYQREPTPLFWVVVATFALCCCVCCWRLCTSCRRRRAKRELTVVRQMHDPSLKPVKKRPTARPAVSLLRPPPPRPAARGGMLAAVPTAEGVLHERKKFVRSALGGIAEVGSSDPLARALAATQPRPMRGALAVRAADFASYDRTPPPPPGRRRGLRSSSWPSGTSTSARRRRRPRGSPCTGTLAAARRSTSTASAWRRRRRSRSRWVRARCARASPPPSPRAASATRASWRRAPPSWRRRERRGAAALGDWQRRLGEGRHRLWPARRAAPRAAAAAALCAAAAARALRAQRGSRRGG